MIYIKTDAQMNLSVTMNGTLYRGDNLSNRITFLVPTYLNEIDISKAKIYLSYIRADGSADIVQLNQNTQLYNDSYYQYSVPITCKMTKYSGEVCMWLTLFTSLDHGGYATAKTSECVLRVSESKSLDEYMGDDVISALYQMQEKIARYHPESEQDTTDNG